jgi:hydroxymethylglutaryl-CoA lyase/(R)-citramalyl-CoA lyase
VRIHLCDVGPRDGLQNDKAVLGPDVRAELCRRLAQAGLERVEAASFVNPRLVPAMAGAEEVMAALPDDGTAWSALVLNRKGLDRALAAGAREIHYAYPLTDTYAQRNQNTTVEAAAGAAREIVDAAHAAGARATVTLSVAFGCPFEGRVDPGVVIDHAQRNAPADEIMLADTIGVGVPAQVRRLLHGALATGTPVGLHLHNTRNTGYANALTGIEHGATILDASIGGLGGCPFAPRATGNVATEDLVYLLRGEGVETGVDLEALIGVSEWLSGVLGRELPGLVQRAGDFPAAAQLR